MEEREEWKEYLLLQFTCNFNFVLVNDVDQNFDDIFDLNHELEDRASALEQYIQGLDHLLQTT